MAVWLTPRRAHTLPAMTAHYSCRPHQARNSLAATTHTLGAQLGMHPRRPIGAAAGAMDRPDTCRWFGVGLATGGATPPAPGIVTTRGDPQHAAHPAQGVMSLLSLDELKHG